MANPPDSDDGPTARDAVLAGFRAWLEKSIEAPSNSPDDIDEIVADASTFLAWRDGYSTGDLTGFSRADLDDFLLDWLPLKFVGDASLATWSLSNLLHYLAVTGHLAGGIDRAVPLMNHVEGRADDVAERMSDRSNFGMGKSLLAPGPADVDNPLAAIGDLLSSGAADALDRDELQALLSEKMAEYNALPHADRIAITDPLFDDDPEPIEIPIVHVPPPTDAVLAAAAASELVASVDRFVAAVAETKIPLTPAGNIKVADAIALAERIDTADVVHIRSGVRVHSSLEMSWLTMIDEIARDAAAVDVLKTRLRGNQQWDQLDRLEQVRRITDAFLSIGPLRWRYGTDNTLAVIAEFLDDGVAHWLSFALPNESVLDIDAFVGSTLETAELRFVGLMSTDPTSDDWFTSRMIDMYFDEFEMLRFAGIVDVEGRFEEERDFGDTRYEGGTFTLTALGQDIVPGHVRNAGYTFASIGGLADASAATLINAIASTSIDPDDALARWRPAATTTDRADEIAAAAVEVELGVQRVIAFELLNRLEPVADVGPSVRQLLDTPIAGHAALFLLNAGLATDEAVGGFLDISPLVDMLSTELGEPEALADLFVGAQEQAHDDLLDEMWRIETDEVGEILDILGRHLPNKKMAKAARKSALRHRSRMANLR